MEDIDREHFESILAGEKAIFMVGKKPFGKSTLAEKLRAQEGFRVYDENDSYEGKIDGTTWEKRVSDQMEVDIENGERVILCVKSLENYPRFQGAYGWTNAMMIEFVGLGEFVNMGYASDDPIFI